MVDLPYESLLGVSYGLLAGIVPAVAVGLGAVGFGVVRDRRLPTVAGIAVVPVAIAIVVAMGAMGTGSALAQGYRIALLSVVSGLLGLLATSQGNRVATELPRDRTFPIVRGRALSGDAIDAVDAAGQVTIRPTGAIREFDGYPPLSPALRTALEDGAWRFPADLQLAELERRLERRLRTAHDLSLVEVSIDGRGRATIAAAPPAKGVARTLSDGVRAVTVRSLLPTGLEAGDIVTVGSSETTVEGEVLAIDDHTPNDAAQANEESDPNEPSPTDLRRRADTGTDGGSRRLTVGVETTDADRLLEATNHRVAARPSGDNHEFEAAALLEAAGQPVSVLEPTTDESIDPDATLGVRSGEDWQFAVEDVPDGIDRAFVAGTVESRDAASADTETGFIDTEAGPNDTETGSNGTRTGSSGSEDPTSDSAEVADDD